MSLADRLPWIDALSTTTAIAAAMLLWPVPGPPATPAEVTARAAVVVGVALLAFYYNDLYDFDVPHETGDVFLRLCRAVGVTAILLAATYAIFPGLVVTSTAVSHALLLMLAAVLATRVAVYALAKHPPFAERIVIMGGGALAADLAAQIGTRQDVPLVVVGFLGDPAMTPTPGPRLGAYADVDEVVRRHRPDRIVVAMPDRRGNLPVAQLLACRFRGVAVEDGALTWERVTRRLPVESLTPSALIFGDGFRVSRPRQALQRALSLAVAVTGLVLAAPLGALIAIAITLESRGPVFFVQERVGLGGRSFRLVKFRTMRVGDETCDGVWRRDNASRVTPLGRVLRKYRIDELPQFLNILRGDMNLVGPRPEMASNVATFTASIPFYGLRHEVRPGLTGWAQVKAGYSMTTEEVTRKLCYDLYYVKHASLAFDLRLLVDTVKFVLSGKRPG
ncbi:MAG: sugar transferase [Candidatus Rokubacteria bacterium]|nr:sugar transferase [Candidatus Rokubacteria bacterium]